MGKQYEYEDFKKVVPIIKSKIKEKREEKGTTQWQLAEGIHLSKDSRTTIANWESLKKENNIPSIEQMIELCNFFDADINYFLGKTPISSEDNKIIAKTLNLSLETVGILKKNSEYGTFINNIVSKKELYENIIQRATQLGKAAILEDIINTSLKKDFIRKIRQIFDDFYRNTFPMDISAVCFEKFLCRKIPYSNSFKAVEFLKDNFEEEGTNFVLNRFFPTEENQYNTFCETGSREQHKIIMSSIVEICYDYFISTQVVELSKQRLNIMISSLIDDIIEEEANAIKKRVKSLL